MVFSYVFSTYVLVIIYGDWLSSIQLCWSSFAVCSHVLNLVQLLGNEVLDALLVLLRVAVRLEVLSWQIQGLPHLLIHLRHPQPERPGGVGGMERDHDI